VRCRAPDSRRGDAVSPDDHHDAPRGAASRGGTPGATAWPWLCPLTEGTACEIVEGREWADRRLEAWYDEVRRHPSIRECRERMSAGTADLILLNRPEWDADLGAEASLRACAELLRPGGQVIFMFPNRRFRSPSSKARGAGPGPRSADAAGSPLLPLRNAERRCRALGFSRLRIYLSTHDARYAESIVPFDRTALYARERLRTPRELRGRLRAGAAALGLGSELYPWVLAMAER